MIDGSTLSAPAHFGAVRPLLRWTTEVAVVTAAYVAGALIGFSLVFDTWISAIWPPSGISLAALLLGGYRLWPAIVLGSLLGNFVGLADRDAPTWAAVGVAAAIAVGNALQTLLGAFLIRRFADHHELFARAQNLLVFLVAGPLLSTTISATVGVTLLTQSGLAPPGAYVDAWTSWWLGNVTGDLICTPLIMVWRHPPRQRLAGLPLLECVLAFTALVVSSALVFGVTPTQLTRYPLIYLPVLLVGWTAFRFGRHGAVSAIAVLAIFAVSGTVNGRGAFVQTTMAESLFLLQTFLGLASVSALALAAIVAERTQKEEALREARDNLESRVAERTAQLRALSTRLESVREEERRHIAREIHDELGQLLTALKIDLFWLIKRSEPPQRAKAEGMIEFVDHMVQAVRRIATELRPSVLDHLDLFGTLEWQMQDFQTRTGIACSCNIDCDDAVLDAQSSTEVFRIVQEALTNVARHAGARRVDLYVRGEGPRLTVEVCDDGCGISPAATAGGSLGLVGMRERAARCGGTVRLENGPEGGTTVRIEIPLATTAAEPGEEE